MDLREGEHSNSGVTAVVAAAVIMEDSVPNILTITITVVVVVVVMLAVMAVVEAATTVETGIITEEGITVMVEEGGTGGTVISIIMGNDGGDAVRAWVGWLVGCLLKRKQRELVM